MRVEVHTMRWGDAWWLDLCAPTLTKWCETHGHKLKVWGKDNRKHRIPNPKYPAAKFCVVDMLAEFLSGKSDWFFYVDADVFVDPRAKSLPDYRISGGFQSYEGLYICVDRGCDSSRGRAGKAFRRWVKTRFHNKSKKIRNWNYRNAGVWMCDRTAASQLLEVMKEPFVQGYQEQHHLNLWLWEASKLGMKLSDLPTSWNDMGVGAGRPFGQDTNFYHLAGSNKSKRLPSLIERITTRANSYSTIEGMIRQSAKLPMDKKPPARRRGGKQTN